MGSGAGASGTGAGASGAGGGTAAFRDRLIGHFLGWSGDAVAKATAERGGLIAGIEALNTEGRLLPLEPMKMTAVGEFIAAYGGEASQPASLDELERRMDRGDFDLVAVGRALLQDPEWVVKIRDGRNDELKSFERSAMGVLF